MTEWRVRAKYVYVFGNDCAFVITATRVRFFYCSMASFIEKYVSNVKKARRKRRREREIEKEK